MRITSSVLTLAALAGGLCAQQQLLLPFHHHLSEAAGQTSGGGSIFRTTAGRFQVLYEATNFLNAGVTGPITINRLRLRGEDVEHNHGGQTYAGVTVQVGSTSLSATGGTFSSTWALNWAPVLPDTTTPGLVGLLPTLTVGASLGTAPNNYCIDIDLAAVGAQITFDPTSAEPNLLIEVIMPTAPTPTIGTNLNLIAIQDTTGTAAQIGGSCRSSATVLSLTGTTISPPVINVEFLGAGGYSTLIPATVETYGAACGGSPSTFYQLFAHNQAFDLAGSAMTLTPDNVAAPNVYSVTSGSSAAFDPTQVNVSPNSTGDDSLVTHALGFTLNYPGGSTATIKPCTNGFVWLDAAMTAATANPSLINWLGNTAGTPSTGRVAPCWHDFHAGRNTTTHPNSGLHVLTDISGGPGNAVCYVTWLNVGCFNTATALATVAAHTVHNLQCVIFEASGVIEFRFGTMDALTGGSVGSQVNCITGFTRGQIAATNSVDPQSRDLSIELPFTTMVEGTTNHMGLVPVQAATVPTNAPGRLFSGQSVTWDANNVPVGALLGVQLLDVAATQPGLQAPTITAPGCMLSTSAGALLWEVTFFPPTTVVGTVPLLVPVGYLPTLLGTNIYAQYVLLDGLFAGPDLITAASNGLKHTVGLQ